MSLEINPNVSVPLEEIQLRAIRSQGAGGQNVNKVATAIHLRFDARNSSLPEQVKVQLFALTDRRISAEGIVTIKAQRFRTQEKNRSDALERLKALILKAVAVPKKRVPTKASRASKRRRVDNKTRRGQLKNLRKKIEP